MTKELFFVICVAVSISYAQEVGGAGMCNMMIFNKIREKRIRWKQKPSACWAIALGDTSEHMEEGSDRTEHNWIVDMAVNTIGIAAVTGFYLVILGAGIWAAWRQRRTGPATAESIMLARRNISLFVGVLTTTGKRNSILLFNAGPRITSDSFIGHKCGNEKSTTNYSYMGWWWVRQWISWSRF